MVPGLCFLLACLTHSCCLIAVAVEEDSAEPEESGEKKVQSPAKEKVGLENHVLTITTLPRQGSYVKGFPKGFLFRPRSWSGFHSD